MTAPQQQRELFGVTLKTSKELEREAELVRAYQRGYEDGYTAHSTASNVNDMLDYLQLNVLNELGLRLVQTDYIYAEKAVLRCFEQLRTRATPTPQDGE